MSAEDLYQAIKQALLIFGLKWSEKDKVRVLIFANGVHFTYKNESYIYLAEGK